jgi:hypothetical protein
MRMRFNLSIITLLLAVILSSCATKSPLEQAAANNVAITPDQAQINACLEFVAQQEEKELARYDSLTDKTDRAMALMHRETMGMIKNVWGKDNNQCRPGTNVWDAYIVWAKETEETKRTYAKEGGSTVRFLGGVAGAAYTVTDLAAKAGDLVLGDKNTAGQDVNKAGQAVTNSGTKSSTTTQTKQESVQVATGEGANAPATQSVTQPTPAAPPAIEDPLASETTP